MSDIRLHHRSAKQISTEPLPGPSFVLRMADEESLLAPIKDEFRNCAQHMDLIFNDSDSDYGLVRSPTPTDAMQIMSFFEKARNDKICGENFIAQCQAGVGRSQAVIAALCAKLGRDNSQILRNGTYNRHLYRLLMAEIGQPVVEPLVSVVVRVKYDVDRLSAFLLSMKRQRYQNWEVIAVTDGYPLVEGFMIKNCLDDKTTIIKTPVAKGRWGHPYRQLGIDAARGEYINLNNDDNVPCPGFLDQMVFALQSNHADIAVCQLVHSYSGWSVTPTGSDLACWLAKTSVVRQHPWVGIEADYEWRYLQQLCEGRIAVPVERPLVCKN